MSDKRNDDLFFSDIEKLKEKYAAYNLEEEEDEQAARESILKSEPTQVEFEAPKPIDTSVFRDETFEDRDVYSTTDTPQPIEDISVAPVEPVVDIPVKPDIVAPIEPDVVAPVEPDTVVPSEPEVTFTAEPKFTVSADPSVTVPIEQPKENKPFVQPAKAENVFSDGFAPVADEFDDLDDANDISVIKQGASIFSAAAEKKVKKQKAQKTSAPKKKSKKLLVIILAIAIPIALWVAAFATDLILVNKWYTPFFCVETAEYENGSKNYVGLFYKIQFHVEEDGDISGECLPWFVEGPNDKI